MFLYFPLFKNKIILFFLLFIFKFINKIFYDFQLFLLKYLAHLFFYFMKIYFYNINFIIIILFILRKTN